ncbi:cell wall hydrolase [Paenibacillus sp.]|uniref:cell wall hydrolase n=1 Tax=Paenibacillus sp. TaxID=58172 RepID=UPI0028128B15|nr:cell wall hydrolase [Paenibacillus sp.]
MNIHKLAASTAASLLLAASLLAPAPNAAAKPLQPVVVDGTRHATAALQREGSLLVPAVFLRKMGVSVQWDENNQAVVLQKNGVRLSLTAGPDGVVHKPEGTYVPLRNAAEKLGMSVAYDASTRTADITTTSFAAKSASVTDEDVLWLERITEAEAGGEAYEGKVAVAASILNRIDDPNWPDTIQGVIFQIVEVDGVEYYQYSPVADGRIYEAKPSEETRKAVRAALDGSDPTDGATVFYNPRKTDNAWVRERPVSKTIGNHVFSY